MKWAIAIGSGYCSWALYESKRAYAPVALVLVLLGGIHFFARMRKADWELFNWSGVVAFTLASILLLWCLRKGSQDANSTLPVIQKQ